MTRTSVAEAGTKSRDRGAATEGTEAGEVATTLRHFGLKTGIIKITEVLLAPVCQVSQVCTDAACASIMPGGKRGGL
jgi:hypothetical protein